MSENKFKSALLEKKWIDLQKQKNEVSVKKPNKANLEKIDVLISLMSVCKKGFNLPEAKIKKIIKHLKQETGNERVRYGTLPIGLKPKSMLYKDLLIQYTEKEGQIVFREYDKKDGTNE